MSEKEFGKRYYIRTAPYAIANVIEALSLDKCVRNITLGMEDGDLLIAYTFDKYALERKKDNNKDNEVKLCKGMAATYAENPSLCDSCSHPLGYSTCHDCYEGSNFSKRTSP